MQVIKRDGSLQPFDFEKIKNAVNKAFNAEYKSDAPEEFIDYLKAICNSFKEDKALSAYLSFSFFEQDDLLLYTPLLQDLLHF